jgi:hypothetical protein
VVPECARDAEAAARVKHLRMKFAGATHLDRKSGGGEGPAVSLSPSTTEGAERRNLLVLRRKLALPAKRWIVGTVSGIFGSGDETIDVQDELAGGGRHVASVLSVGAADLREWNPR